MWSYSLTVALLASIPTSWACGSCYGPTNHIEHVRHVKRMQPDALNATYGPKGALEWGQLNVLHTTDTHGWLEGHLKETNYGADWGDFVSFSLHMKKQARSMGVDLLLVDTGDLHDGAGLSDATTPDAKYSLKVFDKVEYDLLAIGNHELYLADVANQTVNEISTYWGEKYLTSNVQYLNQETGEWQYIGRTHRYFTTEQGLRIMAFGVLFDFDDNVNTTKVITANTMIKQQWFIEAINSPKPIDAFVVIGHNPSRDSTFQVVLDAIRDVHPNIPVQFFGGHSHIRDFVVYDESSTSLESGRYCETLGWFSMSGFDPKKGHNVTSPAGVPNPTRKATENSTSPYVYSRRYLDWNRRTFEYHAKKADRRMFDTGKGLNATSAITGYREQLDLEDLYGCVPQDYCMTCAPFNSSGNIFPLLSKALAATVVSEARKDKARYVITNTGGVRFDMYEGPFTYDDNFIVSPFDDALLFIPDVPFAQASTLLDRLNQAGASEKRRKRDLAYMLPVVERDVCVDPFVGEVGKRDAHPPRITRRQVVDLLVPGYTTRDDFGADGDDTAHAAIPSYAIPDFFQGAAGLDADGYAEVADVVFVDFIESDVLKILGSNYSSADATYYIGENFTTRDYLPLYIKQAPEFQVGLPHCATA
ncbi:Ser/Thr protein phosphatase family protein [Xylariomycetidae sp. FL0641]|nr:Ser/Thr protein phosphatase family protein [Xylariomycetidae sp. FL0641]